MSARRYHLGESTDTVRLGAALAKARIAGLVIYLRGDLGAGKTTLARGFIQALGYAGPVKSPTYTLLEEYAVGSCQIFHFDLYRLGEPDELEFLGVRDCDRDQAVWLVEWPERACEILPSADITVNLGYRDAGRVVCLEASTPAGEAVLEALDGAPWGTAAPGPTLIHTSVDR